MTEPTETVKDKQPPGKSRFWLGVLIVAAFIVGGGWLAYKYFWNSSAKIGSTGDASDSTANLNNDPLCAVVKSQGLRCVVALGSENLLGPGHFVAFSERANPDARVPYPDGDLFRKDCLVPGEQVDHLLESLQGQETQNTVVLGEATYHLSRGYEAGANLPFPKFNDLVLKAGPKLSEVQDIVMSTDDAWLKIVDVNDMLDVIGHAGIRKSCLEGVENGQYSVISKALIAKTINIDVKDKQGKSIGLSAAASSGQVTVSGGASANADVDQEIRTKTATPVVLGVFFFPTSVFQGKPAVTQTVVYAASGELSVTVSGNGGLGAFGQQTRTGTLGKPVTLNAQGTESSECNGGFERTFSTAFLNGGVEAPDSQSLDVTLNGMIRGGHYATGTCAFGNIVGKVGHDNGVSLVGTFNGDIRTIVRSDDTRELEVQTTNLPADARIEVKNPDGGLINGSAPMAQSNGGSLSSFELSGAGVYLVSARWTFPASVNGASTQGVGVHSTLRVEVIDKAQPK